MRLIVMRGCLVKRQKACAMSDQTRVVLVGSTGLIGRAVIKEAVGRPSVHLVAVARREVPLPKGARMGRSQVAQEGDGDER